MSPKIIGMKVPVVETDHMVIDEYVGNLATKTDSISVAHVVHHHHHQTQQQQKEPQAPQGSNDPWNTIQFDEWICLLQGRLEIQSRKDGSTLMVQAGQTVKIEKGDCFRTLFPAPPDASSGSPSSSSPSRKQQKQEESAATKYVAVCLPAFSLQRCSMSTSGEDESSKRSNNDSSKGSVGTDTSNTTTSPPPSSSASPTTTEHVHGPPTVPEVVYHMCEKSKWDNCCQTKAAYFPPTFTEDGRFTHATAAKEKLIETANHFYQSSRDHWVCLEINTAALMQLGIVTVMEAAKSVGTTAAPTTATSAYWNQIYFPHIYGGIPTSVPGVVTNVYPMKRQLDGKFLSIAKLSE